MQVRKMFQGADDPSMKAIIRDTGSLLVLGNTCPAEPAVPACHADSELWAPPDQGVREMEIINSYAASGAAAAMRAELSRQQQALQGPAATPSKPPPLEAREASVRRVVVDWLVEVVSLMRLGPATLAAAVDLLDAFLGKQSLRPPDSLLQLLALSCLSLAIRREENAEIPLAEWVALAADDATGRPLYQPDDFCRMGDLLLETLGCCTLLPSPHSFLRGLLHCLEADPWVAQRCLDGAGDRGGRANTDEGAKGSDNNLRPADAGCIRRIGARADFLTELALPCAPLRRFAPSTIATACLLLALQLENPAGLETPPWGCAAPTPSTGTASADSGATAATATAATAAAASAAHDDLLCSGVSGFDLYCTMDSVASLPTTTSPGPTTPLPCAKACGGACAAAAAGGGGVRAAAAAATALETLASAFGVTPQQLAPGLDECGDLLRSLYETTMRWVEAGSAGEGEGAGEGNGGGIAVAPAAAEPTGEAEALACWLSPAVVSRHAGVVSELMAGKVA